jgi:Mor family transcriptional regulator
MFGAVSKPGSHLDVGELVALVGPETTIKLCFHLGGRRVPTASRCLAWLRRAAILQDRDQGFRVEALAAKYGVSRTSVSRILRRRQCDEILEAVRTGRPRR